MVEKNDKLLSPDLSTEKTILDAARKIFLIRGHDGARMQEIADESGVNKALIHYYFRSKENLYKLVVKQIINEFFPTLFAVFLSNSSLKEKISSFYDLHIGFLMENPLIPQFIITEMMRQPQILKDVFELPMMSGVFEKLNGFLEESIRKGEIKPINPEQFLVNLISLSVFPIVAGPLIRQFIGQSEQEFAALLEERKVLAAEFFINAIS